MVLPYVLPTAFQACRVHATLTSEQQQGLHIAPAAMWSYIKAAPCWQVCWHSTSYTDLGQTFNTNTTASAQMASL
jgi:hypothetical protein